MASSRPSNHGRHPPRPCRDSPPTLIRRGSLARVEIRPLTGRAGIAGPPWPRPGAGVSTRTDRTYLSIGMGKAKEGLPVPPPALEYRGWGLSAGRPGHLARASLPIRRVPLDFPWTNKIWCMKGWWNPPPDPSKPRRQEPIGLVPSWVLQPALQAGRARNKDGVGSPFGSASGAGTRRNDLSGGQLPWKF